MDWVNLFWFLMLIVAIILIGAFFASPAHLILRALRSDDEFECRDSERGPGL